MKKIPALISICTLFLFIGCKQTKDVRFWVYNGCSAPIHVEYITFENNDTNQLTIGTDTISILLQTQNTSGGSNWFYDYKLHINGIYNNLGDTLNFDPNVSEYWHLDVGDPTYYYRLSIADTDF